MEQFEQLLTCCVCLDRYRNPKLLPCQHSFCMEPCMDGLVDYVRRQVKCPECRAEHRIPYQGVQGFPTNVTLQRFLELHIEISGELPDPTAGQIMERCNVCSEKSYCSLCGHCDKKVCEDCKGAHKDILRREIARINNQIRRGIHRLQDILAIVEKNMLSLQTNCSSVSEEVDEIYRRLGKALKDRTESLRNEIDRYHGTEMRNLATLKDNLELEIGNISSNCDLADNHINEDVEWDDNELMDAKEIFLKTVEFLRNFDYEASDYARRVRFLMAHDPNQLVQHVANYGELNINTSNTGFTTGNSGGSHLQPSGGPGLMRSKSDHRLATQFRQQEERGYGDNDEPLLGGRKFGDRRPAPPPADKYSDRYGRGTEYGGGDDYSYDPDSSSRSRRFRSRFVRSQQQGEDSDNEQSSKNVRFNEQAAKEKERVFDTEDVARGPLSGIFRLTDSPRVMKRLQENEPGKKKPKEAAPPPPIPQVPQPKAVVPKKAPTPATRQISEDDEIARIKKQNKGAGPSERTTEAERPAAERVAALKRTTDEDERRRAQEASSEGDSDESGSTPHRGQRKTSAATSPTVPVTRAIAAVPARESPPIHKKPARSDSSESSTSSENNAATPVAATIRNTEPEKKEAPVTSTGAQRFQSRFLPPTRPTPPPAEPSKDDDSDTSSEEETDSSEESEEETPTTRQVDSEMAKSDIGALLARSSNARETAQENKVAKDGSPSNVRLTYNKPEEPITNRYRTRSTNQEEEPTRQTTTGRTGYTSRFLNKPKTSAVPAEEEEPRYGSPKADDLADDESKYPQTGRSRYLALKDRRNRLARSRSTHTGFGANDDDELDDPVSPTTASPSAYLASKYGSSSTGGSDLARSRSSHALKSRESSPDRITTSSSATSNNAGQGDGAYSSWARYLKTKYGGRAGKERENATGTPSSLSPSSSAAARRLSLGLPLRSASEMVSSDDDQKNAAGSPISPTAATAVAAGIAAVDFSPRSQYLQKRRQLFKVGSRGSEPGCFTWPRGIAVGPDNTMVVADSSNHRVQVFDNNGIFVREFGTYGSGEGEFDCLAGVAVNRIGQYIIADRYNHRIQVMDPSGRFLRAFGSQGTGDGRFNYPWGITTDALGFIYVCDKENHRVQVFQSDGTFVGKFGSFGHKVGQLEHPHYIAVSNTNRVIVSDSNNHRIQIFDVNGRVLSSFGTEGSEEGQFKFPRGVAVDDQGYICVADSGNNRIQIFQPDGTFLRAFGSWGSGDAEFKGLEGIAVMSNGNIIVCDRENHRVQVF